MFLAEVGVEFYGAFGHHISFDRGFTWLEELFEFQLNFASFVLHVFQKLPTFLGHVLEERLGWVNEDGDNLSVQLNYFLKLRHRPLKRERLFIYSPSNFFEPPPQCPILSVVDTFSRHDTLLSANQRIAARLVQLRAEADKPLLNYQKRF